MAADRLLEPGSASPAQPARRLRVLICTEVRLLSDGLTEALNRNPSLEVSGTSSGTDAREESGRLKPDVVLLDAATTEGLALVAHIRKAAPQLRIVVVALTETAETVIAWAEAGISGYIPRTARLAEVAPMLIGIVRGEQVCATSVAAALLKRLSPDDPGKQVNEIPAVPALTAREREVIELIGAGLCNKDIARRLNIGLATTKSHVHNLLTKLKLQRRSQAALWMHKFERDGGFRVRTPETTPFWP